MQSLTDVAHRDPRVFAEPEESNPERWISEIGADLPRFVHFPFGGGARRCMGEPLAWTEAVLLFAAIARKSSVPGAPGGRVEMLPGTRVPDEAFPQVSHWLPPSSGR